MPVNIIAAHPSGNVYQAAESEGGGLRREVGPEDKDRLSPASRLPRRGIVRNTRRRLLKGSEVTPFEK